LAPIRKVAVGKAADLPHRKCVSLKLARWLLPKSRRCQRHWL